MLECARPECRGKFEAKTHNQKYCSDECCRIATNKRIMEKYYEKKAIKNGAPRACKCGNLLSRYNHEDTCSKCQTDKKSKQKKDLMEIISVFK